MKFILILYIFAIIKICNALSIREAAKEESIENTSVACERTTELDRIVAFKVLIKVAGKKLKLTYNNLV